MVDRGFFFFLEREREKERGLIDRGPIRQGTILVKGTCLREGLIKVGGLLNRGSLFRVEPIRGGGAIKERVLLERWGRLLTSGRLIRQRYHLNKWCFSKRRLAG